MSSIYSNPRELFAMMARANPDLPIPPSFPSPAEVRGKATAYSQQIFNSWTTLRDILARREEVIRKRWMKKSKEQRKKILLAAWPGMPERHRPDFYELEKSAGRAASRKVEVFKYPYVNQEDLVQGRALLLFLNARGRNPPHAFAHADLDATHVGQTSKAVVPVFLNEYTMYIAGQSEPHNYGRLVSWDDDDDAFMSMTSIGFGAEKLYCSVWQFTPQDGIDWKSTKMGQFTSTNLLQRRRWGLPQLAGLGDDWNGGMDSAPRGLLWRERCAGSFGKLSFINLRPQVSSGRSNGSSRGILTCAS